MLTCKEIIHLVTESMDRPLRWKERFGLWFHILMCRYCYRFCKQVKWIHWICKNESNAIEEDLFQTGTLSPEAKDRIQKKITEHLN